MGNLKFFLLFILTLCLFFTFVSAPLSAKDKCEYKEWQDVWTNLDTCLTDSQLVSGKKTEVETWFKETINKWTQAVGLFLWVLAVWSIVYGSLLLVLSTWEDEKIKKAKDVIKWWIIGFLCVISASSIILLVVSVMYSI